MPARLTITRRIFPTLFAVAVLALTPADSLAQQRGSVFVSATVASSDAPRVSASVQHGPSQVVSVAQGRSGADGVEVVSALEVTGNTGYRVLVRALPSGEGAGQSPRVWVRDVHGVYRVLHVDQPVTVARHGAVSGTRSVGIVCRVEAEGSSPAPRSVPLTYEVVYDPVT